MKKHTPGKLIRAEDAQPGTLIYLRPDHTKYLPEYFAIVIERPNTRVWGHVTSAFVEIEPVNRRINGFVDPDRAVEVVTQELTAECVGLSRREIARAVGILRAGNVTAPIFVESRTDDLASWIARAARPQTPLETETKRAYDAYPDAAHDLKPEDVTEPGFVKNAGHG